MSARRRRNRRARRASLVRQAPGEARPQAQRNRQAGPEGDPRPAVLPRRRRARLSDARARLRNAVGRREPAHPARLADRLGPHRRALRARRALDRPAPARQCPPARHAAAAARPRQFGDRRRARRGCDPRPPIMSSTSAPAPGIHGGEIVAQGTAAEIMADPKLAHRAISHRRPMQVAVPRRRRKADPEGPPAPHRQRVAATT